jgi:phosphoribosylglycinamide formyltransferase 1
MASVSQATVTDQLVPSWKTIRSRKPRSGSPLPLVVLASGNGSNLQAILDRFRDSSRVEVVGVASNHSDARALRRAAAAGIPTAVFPRPADGDRIKRDLEMAQWIKSRRAVLVVSAGYLELLSPDFVRTFRNRIVNIHPSLLPELPGLGSIQRAYEGGLEKSGVTIHFVDEGVDTGLQIRQRTVFKEPGDDLRSFEARIHSVEHELLPEVIDQIASGEIAIGGSGSRYQGPKSRSLAFSPQWMSKFLPERASRTSKA